MEREKKWIFHEETIRWNWDIIIWKREEEMLDIMDEEWGKRKGEEEEINKDRKFYITNW